MMKKEFENGRAVVAALFAVCVASAAIPQGLQAQATILTACYVPDVGLVYRIKAAGLPDECTETTHVEFSWNMEGPAGPQGDTGDTGPQGPSGFTGLEVVSQQTTIPEGSRPPPDGRDKFTLSASCSTGKTVIGGSFVQIGPRMGFEIVGESPTANRDGWEAILWLDGNEWMFTVYAICVST